jgi:hypothetical protein
MNGTMKKQIVIGMLLSIAVMFIIAAAVTYFKYANILQNLGGYPKLYITLLGYGFFGNVALYGLFWYLDKEYIQRGIMIVTVLTSLIFIINRFL